MLSVGSLPEKLQYFRVQVHGKVNDCVFVIELANLTLGEIKVGRQLIHICIAFHGAFHG
jgi:hypothetical protein